MDRERSEPRKHFWRMLFERSERSERSELCGTPSRRAGEPGHEQSGGLFVPGERPVHKDRRGLQGQGSLSAAKTATVSAPSGTVCRGALISRQSERERTTAAGRAATTGSAIALPHS